MASSARKHRVGRPEHYKLLNRPRNNCADTSQDAVVTIGTSNNGSEVGDTTKHKDALGRTYQPKPPCCPEGYFLDPSDARLKPLRTQDCRNLKNTTPWAIRLTYWIFRSVISTEDGDESIMGGVGGWLVVSAKFLPGVLAMLFLLFVPQKFGGNFRQDGNYDPVPYRERLYAKSARNKYEDATMAGRPSLSVARSPRSASYRAVDNLGMLAYETGPKYLCFIDNNASVAEDQYTRLSVQHYMQRSGSPVEPDFVFISYTRKQFSVATEQEMRAWNLSEAELAHRVRMSAMDRRVLGRMACRAARSAGVEAFWIDFECLVPEAAHGETADDMLDVYRICDIVRVSQSMVIVRGPPVHDKEQPHDAFHKSAWLQQWGQRLWTVPEALLCPNPAIGIYTVGEPNCETMLKRRLAAAAWEDADNMHHLVDHFEGSIRLTPLELVSIALEGLMRRQTDMRISKSDSRHSGEASYSLMGLLQRRPAVNRQDGEFEAFARLSLSNDSDNLLERLLCFLPQSHHSPWHDMKDSWGVKLWDVEPLCQVAGLVDNRTVTLDGAFGATIQWHSLEQVGFFKRRGFWNTVLLIAVRGLPLYILLALISVPFAVIREFQTVGIYISGVFFASIFVLAFATPVLMLALYGGNFWSTQAFFFGMRGIPDLGRVEECIFGLNCGRLKWSASGSRLSMHRNVHGECVALAPRIEHQVDTSLQLFTIIDTFTLTATAFYAEKPPSVVMVCGREGGMLRAVLCSYDWATQTFCRESVVRIRTIALQRMTRVDRFRFCLNRTGRDA